MVETKNVLNLGLDALFKAKSAADAGIDKINEKEREAISYLNVNQLLPGKYQPRKFFDTDELNNLAESIKEQGILQPLIVRRVDFESFEIIAGERRWRASKLAGLNQVPAIIRDVPDSVAAAFAIIENVQRQDLNPIEEAESYRRLINEFTLTHEEVSRIVGKSRATVSNTIRLLNLNDSVIHLLRLNQLEMGHARAILAAPQENQREIASIVIEKKYTVRETEKYVSRLASPKIQKKIVKSYEHDPSYWENKLSELLNVDVNISFKKNLSGKVSMSFESEEQIKRVLDAIEVSVQ